MEIEQQKRVEDATKSIVSELDSGYLRKMQATMYRCAARCCEDSSSSMESVHRCIENCQVSLNDAQNFVQTEFTSCQNRLQRCILECNDAVKDKMGSSPTQDEVKKYSDEFETCAVKCVDKHVEQLPIMTKRMKEVLSKKMQQSSLYYPN
ncbi:protein FAM136A [Halyomorpha halys]|uniref:protein FAM136A n=1 Tax=Halyomorpha halys TaxID=286706 RepID=UPI0006D523A8|nr:protein FAM136A-like [Halyomorpha halys]